MVRRGLIALGVACAGALVGPAWVLGSGHTLVWRDTAQLYAPLRPTVAAALRALRLPGWNPWEGGGVPLFGHLLHSVLHPVSVAVGLLTDSTDALIVALVAFAAAGAWVAARALGASAPAGVAAALAFASSGFVLGSAENLLYLFSAATGPWAVAGLAASALHRLGWAAAAAGVAALCLAGDPGAVFAFTLMGLALAWVAGGWPGAGRAAGGAALGVAAAAVQLVPAWRYVSGTARGAGLLEAGDLQRWALAPWRLLELVAPGFFVGIPRSYDAPVFAALDGASPDRFPFTPSVFVGGAVLLLAYRGAGSSRAGRALAVLAVLFLWLALGHRLGAQQLIQPLPVLGAVRYWEKMVGPLTLCLALAAALGADALRDAAPGSAGRAAAVAAAVALVCAAALSVPASADLFGADARAAGAAREQLRTGLVHAAIALALTAMALRAPARWRVEALAAVVLVQSVAASPFALHLGHPAALDVRPPALAAAAPGPRIVAPLGCDFAAGQGPFDAIDLLNVCERRSGRPSTNDEARVDSLAVYSGLTPRRWDLILHSGPVFWPVARRLGTTHVLAREPRNDAEAGALRAATAGAVARQALDGGRLLVWSLPHRAWASFAPAVRPVPDLDAAAAALWEEVAAGGEGVVVETAGDAPAASPGRVLGIRRDVEEVAVDAESAGEGTLVVNDAWAPGWRAFVDGAETELLPADVLVRAVRWPPGRHRLVMRYEIPGLRLGRAVSGLAVAVAAALAGWQLRRRPGRRATAA